MRQCRSVWPALVSLVVLSQCSKNDPTSELRAPYFRTTSPGATNPIRWPQQSITIRLQAASRWDIATPIVRRGLAAWSHRNTPCTGMDFKLEVERVERPAPARDGVNSVTLLEAAWCRSGDWRKDCYSSNEVAMTTVYSGDSGTEYAGLIREADVEINAVDFQWGLRDGNLVTVLQDGTLLPLQAVLLHEIGHLLGLSENCVGVPMGKHSPKPFCQRASRAVRASTMFPLWTGRMASSDSIGQAEKAFLCEVYPASAM